MAARTSCRPMHVDLETLFLSSMAEHAPRPTFYSTAQCHHLPIISLLIHLLLYLYLRVRLYRNYPLLSCEPYTRFFVERFVGRGYRVPGQLGNVSPTHVHLCSDRVESRQSIIFPFMCTYIHTYIHVYIGDVAWRFAPIRSSDFSRYSFVWFLLIISSSSSSSPPLFDRPY